MLNVSSKLIDYNCSAYRDFRVCENDLYTDNAITEYDTEVLDSPVNFILDKYYSGMQVEDFRTIIAAPLKRFERLIREYEKLGNMGGKEASYRDDETLRNELATFAGMNTMYDEIKVDNDALQCFDFG